MSSTVAAVEAPRAGDSQPASAAVAGSNCCGGEAAWTPCAFNCANCGHTVANTASVAFSQAWA